jgi:branched-chain amino acid transport system ATP-binding protein
MPGSEPAPPAPRTALLEVVDLSVRYGGVSAVHGISIEVGPGEAVGIIGANGAGKTSTLKAILGLAPRTARRIRFDGQDLLRTPARNVVRCGIGYVPEGRHVFSPLSVEKNLLLGAYTRRWDQQTRASLGEVYEIFPVLSEMRARQAGTLSGGQQQMLAIGRALMSHPRMLVLDEPSMGLSPILVGSILKVLLRLRDQGLSILLVEQNATLTFEATQRCLVMENGRAVLSGTAAELRHNSDVRRIYLGI